MTYHRPSTFRDTRANAKPKIPEVETQKCPQGGLHVLACDRWGRVRCEGCHLDWAALDEAVRAS